MQWPKEQTMIYKTLSRKLMLEQQNSGVNSYAPEG